MNEKDFRKGYIAALEWVLNEKPSRNDIKSKLSWHKEMLEE